MHLPLALAVALATLSAAHPGEDHHDEAAQIQAYRANAERSSLAHCAEVLKAGGVVDRNIKRRVAKLEEAREKRGIKKRDLNDVINTDHNKTELGFTTETPYDELFAGINSCILTPEVTLGPYYVSGESIRENVVDGQVGVDLVLDYQLINVDTCEPIPEIYLEIWHSNATGVYSGVNAQGNGNFNDKTNINRTFSRGIQLTDSDGVAQFETFFPGHYIGRTNHIHVLAHANATLFPNETLGNEIYSSHVGQTYFDQDLIYEVEKLQPYASSGWPFTTNAQDFILAQAANQDVDPVIEWTLLGDSVDDGIFGWLAYGINITATKRVVPAVFRYEDGGHVNPEFGPGFPPPPGGSSEDEDEDADDVAES